MESLYVWLPGTKKRSEGVRQQKEETKTDSKRRVWEMGADKAVSTARTPREMRNYNGGIDG